MSNPLPARLPIAPFSRTPRFGALSPELPGSKSITNRALILAAFAAARGLCGAYEIVRPLDSRDTRLMCGALRALGFSVETLGASARVSLKGELSRAARIDVGNAGTVARFFTAFLAALPGGEYALDGDAEMRRRPMAGLLDALRAGGTQVECLGEPDCFPFVLRPCAMREAPAELAVDAARSSQIFSALLMSAPFWQARCALRLKGATVSAPFVSMTARMVSAFFGGSVLREKDGAFFAEPPARLASPPVYAVEPDATAASYFLSLPIVAPVRVRAPLSPDGLQGDAAYVRALEKSGLCVACGGGECVVSPSSAPCGIDEDFNAFSDTFLTFAALAPLLRGRTVLRGLAHTRLQETDRLRAVARELGKLGQRVEEREDALVIDPDLEALRALTRTSPAVVETYKDHRMAMSFAVLGAFDLHGDGRAWLAIDDPACCGKTFPEFFDELESLRMAFKSLPPLIVIAVDGGAASGKSSTSRGVAERLNLLHVDTGAHYRALAFALLGAGVSPDDEAAAAAALGAVSISTVVEGRESRIAVNGAVPADADLRSGRVNACVAQFAAMPRVRAFLRDYQRGQREVALAHGFRGLIMEGRDIGSVIFPDAPHRFYLEASAQVRAARRAAEGLSDSIAARDKIDSSRKTAPLAVPEGAVRIDNSQMTLEQVVDAIVRSVETA